VTVRSHGYHPGRPAEPPLGEASARPRRRASWADTPWRSGPPAYDWRSYDGNDYDSNDYDSDDPPTEPIPVIPPGPVVPDWSRLAPAQPYEPSTGFFTADIDVASDTVLTDESLVRHQRATPTEGWRLALFAASGGRINPGQSAHEAARVELVHRIRRPLPAPHRVAVVSVKGGVGKTTVAACLGLVLAELRGDRVVALDANPDAGTLSERLTGPGGPTVRDLYEDMPNLASVAELTRYTRSAGRLHVLGSEQEPAMGEAFSAEEYLDVTSLLERFYNVIITDSGTGMVHSAMEATLATADSLVIVGSPTVDGANRASRTLSFLADEGYRVAAEQSVVVLCGDRHSPDVDRALIRSHFAARCRAVVDIPPDPHLATGGRITPALWRGPTRDAWYLLAAHVADGFGAPSPTPPAPPFAMPVPDSG
jgi:MinD-like ATPase involved in chromosome partitioning or flagellar assembly